jgi:hypothetical protein
MNLRRAIRHRIARYLLKRAERSFRAAVILWRMDQLQAAQAITAADIRERVEWYQAQRAILDALNRMIARKWERLP